MSKALRVPDYLGVLAARDIDWQFRVYLMRSDPSEAIDPTVLYERLHARLREILANCLSPEFSYLRSGFIIAHYGRRGVTYSFWHWADWEGTWEYFCQAWYCYGRSFDKMVPLDRREPVFCLHELDIVALEAKAFRDIALVCPECRDVTRGYREWVPTNLDPA